MIQKWELFLIAGAVGVNPFCLQLSVLFDYLISDPKLMTEAALRPLAYPVDFRSLFKFPLMG